MTRWARIGTFVPERDGKTIQNPCPALCCSAVPWEHTWATSKLHSPAGLALGHSRRAQCGFNQPVICPASPAHAEPATAAAAAPCDQCPKPGGQHRCLSSHSTVLPPMSYSTCPAPRFQWVDSFVRGYRALHSGSNVEGSSWSPGGSCTMLVCSDSVSTR